MLRKYLDHARMEQLAIPMHTIAVDLVEEYPLVRQLLPPPRRVRGKACHAHRKAPGACHPN
jgi:hypothetical protein